MFWPALTKKELKVLAISGGEFIVLPSATIWGMFLLVQDFLFPVKSLRRLQIFLGLFEYWTNLES
jgi:hypothetical protein